MKTLLAIVFIVGAVDIAFGIYYVVTPGKGRFIIGALLMLLGVVWMLYLYHIKKSIT